MTDKPLLTKEQAKAMEKVEKTIEGKDFKRNSYVAIRSKVEGGFSTPEFVALNDIRNEDFIYALHHGYDVEEDEHDRLLDYYARIFTEGDYSRACNIGRMKGVEDTLNKLGITVEGING